MLWGTVKLDSLHDMGIIYHCNCSFENKHSEIGDNTLTQEKKPHC